jgi:D-lactate dehydrogenase
MRRLLASPSARRAAFVGWTGAAVAVGYAARRADEEQQQRALPSGHRACCDGTTAGAPTAQQAGLKPQLTAIVGAAHVSFGVAQRGARLGASEAFAVCKPGTLQEALACLQACVDCDCCVVPQGANTGLTGGSVPRDPNTTASLDRPSVVLNLSRLTAITAIDGGARLVCLAGAGIQDVLKAANALGVDSHSVLGSFFLNPTVAAGVAFGSGGSQLRKVKEHLYLHRPRVWWL